MKKFTSIFLSMLMLLSITSGISFTAQAASFGDYEYTVLADSTVEITKYTGKEKAVSIPASIDSKQVTAIGKSAFEKTSAAEIVIPEGVTTLCEYAFASENIKAITLPSSITNIDNAFGTTIIDKNGCNEIEIEPDVYSPLSKTELVLKMGSAPSGCIMHYGKASDYDKLNFVIKNDKDLKYISIQSVSSGSEIAVPDAIEGIPVLEISIQNNAALKKITIGNNAKNISIFNCTKLESISVSGKNAYYSTQSGVLFNKDKSTLIVYPAAKSSKSYTIPNSVKTVMSFAFYKSANLTSLTIGKNVTGLTASDFNMCKKLKEFKVNKNNKKLSAKDGVLFDKKVKTLICYPVKRTAKTYTVPKTVKTIESCAFYNAGNLKTLKLYGNIKSIEKNSTFSGCKNLKNVYFGGSKTAFAKITYHNSKNQALKYKNSALKKLMNNAKIHYNAKIK